MTVYLTVDLFHLRYISVGKRKKARGGGKEEKNRRDRKEKVNVKREVEGKNEGRKIEISSIFKGERC